MGLGNGGKPLSIISEAYSPLWTPVWARTRARSGVISEAQSALTENVRLTEPINFTQDLFPLSLPLFPLVFQDWL